MTMNKYVKLIIVNSGGASYPPVTDAILYVFPFGATIYF